MTDENGAPSRPPVADERTRVSGLEVRQLRALVALVDTGSMTAAARLLGVSQSTVSEAVASLERAVGTAVVARRRGARDTVLTAAGRALLPHVRLEALIGGARPHPAAADLMAVLCAQLTQLQATEPAAVSTHLAVFHRLLYNGPEGGSKA